MYIDVKYGKEKKNNNFKDPISDFDIGNKIKCSNSHYSVQGHICSRTSLGKIVLINWVPFTFHLHIKHLVFFYLEC